MLRVAVCSDGSEKSIHALNFMTRLIDRSKGDQIFVVCVETAKVQAESVSHQVNNHFNPQDDVPHGVSKFVTLKVKDPMGNPASTICDYLTSCTSDDDFVHYVVVGNTGADFSSHNEKKYMGSVAAGIITKTRVNVLFYA